jgi:phytoene synthase
VEHIFKEERNLGRNWTEQEWRELDAATRERIRNATSPAHAWRVMTRSSRAVLRNYSTSFFLVTRFLPAQKRAQVDVIYAAVRYPDEVVDTFPLAEADKLRLLEVWRESYVQALGPADWRRSVADGVPVWVAGFSEVVKRNNIPPEHYHSFLDAMVADAQPRFYRDIDDLIDGYIYGSAIVVGYFLAYVYGASAPEHWQRVLDGSRSLGIALQLTNFLRDVAEDQNRGRVYLPLDLLQQEGLANINCSNPGQTERINSVLRRLSGIAEAHYRLAECDLDAFAPDCRVAIQACIDVYRRLNQRIGSSPAGIRHRESVPVLEKLGSLPASKFWRIPLAYMGGL